ncbi:hypothetical protein [Streptomyces sp. Agncl-13]|uniref:hypothetical protein n=1 Tax=Streptomyces sp. Agncl-13 TaxID=3400628 RepID=UPI003A8A9E53
MDESRQSPSGVGAVLRKLAPPPALCGFLLLLALMFTTSYAVGAGAGPIAPGMHGTSGTSGTSGGETSGTGGTGVAGGTGSGSGGMGDMDMHGGGN